MLKKWIIGISVLALLIISYAVIEFNYHSVWQARTKITHPVNYTAKNNQETLTYITSFIPTLKDKRLIRKDLKGPVCYGTPAEMAIKNYSNEALEVLLKRNVDMRGCRPLIYVAVDALNYRALTLLNEYGANFYEKREGASLLDWASGKCKDEENSAKILGYLIDVGLNVNERAFYEGKVNFERRTPLYSALSAGCLTNAKVLLENGADEDMSIYGKRLKSYKNFDSLIKQVRGL